MSHVIGIDSSTTATKAIVVDEAGAVVGTGIAEYGFETPHALWSEQDPQLWVDATYAAIPMALADAGIDGSAVAAVGLTGQMHGLVLLDSDGRPLRPAILWNDQRTEAECDEMRAALGRERMIQISGNDALTGFTAPKILWVRNNEPDVFAQATDVLLPKDYVRLALTGMRAMDRAGGSGTQLFDLAARTWSGEMLTALDLDRAWFPDTFEGTSQTGTITPAAAEKTGLSAGTPVVAGGGDQAAAAVGVGAVRPGTLSLSLGTSGVVFAPMAEMAIEPEGRLHAFCAAIPEQWHFMGVMLSAAGSLRWFRDTVMPGVSFDEVTAVAAESPPGCDGLTFLPYLTGERTPHPDPHATGAFVGLTVRHDRSHMARAVLEGVAFGLRDAFELVRAAAPDIDEVRVTGGGARSPVWRQILADVLSAELATVGADEGAAYGAAALAAVGAGWSSDVEALTDRWVEATEAESPGGGWDATGAYERYRALYPALRPTFTA